MRKVAAVTIAAGLLCPGVARAEGAISCGGAALLGAAQLVCSHVAPRQPTQFCTFTWTLMASSGKPTVVDGSFMLPPGASNVQVYQGSGFQNALSNPIVLCQGRKTGG
ncbi:hypothetical protein SAMN05216548_12327 [Faunimonas pinastri]|uniref:Secreted protein n=1 Tax=Faunimonas pinastri TaxID=1855383 RepID=A0A1H9PXE7_9HYPH|nr:hypothetical protein [Faunimonas pinastri]SER52820.1 hypothetical protein SAMN05216548_12327 [Faunimonas pinastri]